MKRIHFLTQKQINSIIKSYGGYRKYKKNEVFKSDYNSIYFHEKKNKYLWLTIHNNNSNIMITFTDDTGLITKRDFVTINIQKERKL